MDIMLYFMNHLEYNADKFSLGAFLCDSEQNVLYV